MTPTALTGARIFDGKQYYDNHALVMFQGRIDAICKTNELAADCDIQQLHNGLLIPGLIDLQVNGGGGVLFNEHPTVEGIQSLCAAHTRLGTTGLLPTLITATPEITELAIQAGIAAQRENVRGFLGLHLEGPHLSIVKKGAHDASLIRPMNEDDLQLYLHARQQLPALMITVAPESVSNKQITKMAEAGIVVSLGHSNASYEQCIAAFNAGASCATHLYNAMSPLGHREPGLVGAALTHGKNYCGLIADGHHVHPAAINHALSATQKGKPIFLVSDAMPTIGTDMKSFELDGRQVFRENGRLVLSDGTLAGADIALLDAVKYMVTGCTINLDEAIRMATAYPANCIGKNGLSGTLDVAYQANVVHLHDNHVLSQVWIDGRPLLNA